MAAFDTASLTQAARDAGFQLPDGWRPIPQRTKSTLDDSNKSTLQTVRLMCPLIKDACADPLIRDYAGRVGSRSRGHRALVAAECFLFLKGNVRFVIDERPVLELYGETDQVDFLISPSVLMRMHSPAGDCDDFTMLACALLRCNNVPFEIVTIMADRTRPGQWSHIYPRAVMPNGQRMVIDATPPGMYPGWEVPAYDIQRKQVWDADGSPIADSAPPRDTRMHAYRPRRRRGMGADGDFGGEYTGGSDMSTGAGITPDSWFARNFDTPLDPGATTSGSGFNWNSLISNLSSVGSKLGTLALLPKGATMTTLPNGTQVFSNTGLPSSFNVGGAQIGMGTIAIAGIGLIALLAFSGGHK